jgi:hypothetical protein
MGFIDVNGVIQNLNKYINFTDGQIPVGISNQTSTIIDVTPFANPTDNIVNSISFVGDNSSGGGTGNNVTPTYLTPSNVDFYLTSFYWNCYRSVVGYAMPPPTMKFDVTINGVVESLIVEYINTSINTGLIPPNNPNYYFQLKNPIKIDRNTAIIVDMNFHNQDNAGTTLNSGITGFTFDNSQTGLQEANYSQQ